MDKAKNTKSIRSFTPPPEVDYANFVVPKGALDIEIGCGVGLHPIQYQAKNLERTLVAIEHTKEKYERAPGGAWTKRRVM